MGDDAVSFSRAAVNIVSYILQGGGNWRRLLGAVIGGGENGGRTGVGKSRKPVPRGRKTYDWGTPTRQIIKYWDT